MKDPEITKTGMYYRVSYKCGEDDYLDQGVEAVCDECFARYDEVSNQINYHLEGWEQIGSDQPFCMFCGCLCIEKKR